MVWQMLCLGLFSGAHQKDTRLNSRATAGVVAEGEAMALTAGAQSTAE